MRLHSTYFLFIIILFGFSLAAQDTEPTVDYGTPKSYEIGGITLEGTDYLDENVLISLTGLRVGEEISIPGDDIPKAIRNLWKQRLFTNVSIYVEKVIGNNVFLNIDIEERPRLSRYVIKGVKKSAAEEIREKIRLRAGSIFTESMKMNTINIIKKYYLEKGFLSTKVNIIESVDTVLDHSTMLVIEIAKGAKVKVNNINIIGTNAVEARKLKRQMKSTREKVKIDFPKLLFVRKNKKDRKQNTNLYRSLSNLSPTSVGEYLDEYLNLNIFKTSKFKEQDYEEDKRKIIAYYNTKGYRDAAIVRDSFYLVDDQNLQIDIMVDEGQQYYFRDIFWKGNSKYTTGRLDSMLGISKGEVYNSALLDERLYMSQAGQDISSLYMDDGYLFFSITPIELAVDEDSIDLEIRIQEGPQAVIKDIIITGNTKTNEHVIRRELRVLPGNKFSRSDLIRSQREIANLGYFDPEQIEVVPMPNPEQGTVDIEFKVAEKPSDQLELSAGWGGRGNGIIGTLGISFTNFSLSNMFKKGAWRPLPSGDGQKLSVRVQSNGRLYQSYNFSFTEPWLGGRKPNSFSVSFFRSRFNDLDNERRIEGSLITTGVTVALGTRLKWPDDFFTIQPSIQLQRYDLNNWSGNQFTFQDGNANNLAFKVTLARSSVNQPLFPTSGSNIALTFQATLPYSLIFPKRKKLDFAEENGPLSDADRYRWLEYHKWRFNAEWFTTIVGKLVFRASVKMGFLGLYNKDVGLSPFERFELGGEGIANTQFFFGKDIIALRGYDVISPVEGSPIFNKYTLELRYPFSTNPSATIYGLLFAEGGNDWQSISDYDPFDLNRSVGLGLRVFLPMFGLLGFDYGIGFDDVPDAGNSIFSRYGKFSIVLGVEPE